MRRPTLRDALGWLLIVAAAIFISVTLWAWALGYALHPILFD